MSTWALEESYVKNVFAVKFNEIQLFCWSTKYHSPVRQTSVYASKADSHYYLAAIKSSGLHAARYVR